MDILVNAAVWFIGIFQQSATVFTGLVTGIIPLVIVLMTAFNAVIALIGPERIDRLGAAAGKEGIGGVFLRYLILPVVSVFVLTNPMAYTMGRFLPEKFKPGFYDAAVSYVHPPLGIFPHVNPGELFVWLGIATGVSTGYGPQSMANLAVRYLLVGLVVIFIRGLVTERIYKTLTARKAAGEAAGEG
jgi:glucitol/sorbitol PTS system EIIC component